MIAGARLSAAIPGGSSGVVLEAAEAAERAGLDQFWVGDPNSGEGYNDDRYVMVTLSAVAARTRDLRLGAFLHRAAEPSLSDAEFIHIAEDIAVVDQASNGRLEVAFAPGGNGWVDRAEKLLSVWANGWEVGDGRVVPVTPPPAQPILPRLVVGHDSDAARRLGAGLLVPPGTAGSTGVAKRTVLVHDLGGRSVHDWLSSGVVRELQALRVKLSEANANELLVILSGENAAADIQALGTVVGPSVRCATHDVEALSQDAWAWLTEQADLHDPPPALVAPTKP